MGSQHVGTQIVVSVPLQTKSTLMHFQAATSVSDSIKGAAQSASQKLSDVSLVQGTKAVQGKSEEHQVDLAAMHCYVSGNTVTVC